MIGYNPRGCKPATMHLIMGLNNAENKKLPFYASFDTGLTDSQGKTIFFSTANKSSNRDNVSGGTLNFESEQYRRVNLVNGKWKLYPTIFTASGIEYETFILDDIASDSDKHSYVAYNYIDVYVKRDGEFIRFDQDNEELLLGVSLNKDTGMTTQKDIYNSGSQVYSLRLNEDKTYEIKFGDGTTGEKLSPGDKLYIFYLDTNGTDGEIDITTIQNLASKKFTHNQ